MQDVVVLLEELQILTLEEPRKIIGRLTYGLDQDEIELQINKIKQSLPVEIVGAAQNMRQSEEIKRSAQDAAEQILESAKREAARLIETANEQSLQIIESAKIEQERLVAESEVFRLAKDQAEGLRNEAERTAAQIRRGADHYAGDLLSRLESNVDRIAASVRASRAELGSIEAASPATTQNRPAERIRV
jgi:cell division septum initiation protein DivIVA